MKKFFVLYYAIVLIIIFASFSVNYSQNSDEINTPSASISSASPTPTEETASTSTPKPTENQPSPQETQLEAPESQSIKVTPAHLNLGNSTPGNASIHAHATTLEVISTQSSWTLSISGMSFTSDGQTIPIERLQIQYSNNEYVSITNSDKPIAGLLKQKKTNKHGKKININYMLETNYYDSAGDNYQYSLTYTLSPD